jgi:tetratricopeptide (TPR) repeat protein
MPARLQNLAGMLRGQYDYTAKIDQLEEAIDLSRQVIEIMPQGHPDLPGTLNELGQGLKRKFERMGKREDIEESNQVSSRAVATTLLNDNTNLAARLNDLGTLILARYDHWGKIQDLEESLKMSRQAIDITPLDHPNLGSWLINLGSGLRVRFQHTGRLEDLEEAIQVSQKAIHITPYDHPKIAIFLNDLGNHFQSRYSRTRNIDDLEEAIRLSRNAMAVKLTPETHTESALLLNNLGIKLVTRYQHTGMIGDLEEAICLFRRAVHITQDHQKLAIWLENLASSLSIRYQYTDKIEDLEESIQFSSRAIQITPNDHPSLAARLCNLGISLFSRYEQTSKMEDLEKSIEVSRHAVEITSAPPLTRIRAASHALKVLHKRKDYNSAYTVSKEAIGFLSLLHNRSLDLQDQQYILSLFSGLASHACSLAIQIGKPPAKALEHLEQGRGVILGLLMDDRGDTSELKAANPALCAQYERLRFEINAPVDIIEPPHRIDSSSEKREKIFKELEECIHDIRQLPGFSSFHRGPTAEEMKSISHDGNIIIVNVTTIRSDAIVISSDGFSFVSLPCMIAGQAQSWVNENFDAALQNKRGKKNKAYLKFLRWLWNGCVKPILIELDHNAQPSPENLPRVWWIGTGLASSFPFHAARDTSAGPFENTFSRVLSSYTPSIKALMYSRGRFPRSDLSNELPSKLLMVTMAKTPGACELDGVEDETSAIERALKGLAHINALDQPDAATVLRQIHHCDIAHFACHGISDMIDPSQSGLLLKTATVKPKQDLLTVRALFKHNYQQARIAYLSACSTAENRAKGLVDEVLHVVSGFQIAGFRHVIGCLWPADDGVCVEVARSFYAELCKSGTLDYTDRAVSMALHKAVLEISMSVEYGKRPLHWAPYIHCGA